MHTSNKIKPEAGCPVESTERGQMLVLFALAMVVLLGFLSLAVDVGNLYFQRRQLQGLADTAALVGARNWQGVLPNVSIKQPEVFRDIRRYSVANGLQTNPGANEGINEEVGVWCPPITGPFAGQPDYVEVQLTRNVPSLFAGVLGIADFDIQARAVARAKRMQMDFATLSLHPDQNSTVSQGSTDRIVVGSTYSRGETKAQSGASMLEVTQRVYARGGVSGSNITAHEGISIGPDEVPEVFDPQWPPPGTAPSGPDSNWSTVGEVPEWIDGEAYYDIYAGTYRRIRVNPGDKVRFHPGVYRLTQQGIVINGWAKAQGPVVFIMEPGASFEIQAQAEVLFFSGPDYNNIVIYSYHCGNAMKTAGGADVELYGTVYAPCGEVALAGSANGTVHGQVVANTIELTGGAGTIVVHDGNHGPVTPGPTLVE